MKGRRTEEDFDADLERLRKWLDKPRTMASLTARYGIAERTMRKWFASLTERGHIVERVGLTRPTMYRLASRKKAP